MRPAIVVIDVAGAPTIGAWQCFSFYFLVCLFICVCLCVWVCECVWFFLLERALESPLNAPVGPIKTVIAPISWYLSGENEKGFLVFLALIAFVSLLIYRRKRFINCGREGSGNGNEPRKQNQPEPSETILNPWQDSGVPQPISHKHVETPEVNWIMKELLWNPWNNLRGGRGKGEGGGRKDSGVNRWLICMRPRRGVAVADVNEIDSDDMTNEWKNCVG